MDPELASRSGLKLWWPKDMPYLRLLRPEQWVKNVFVFAGVVFARQLGNPAAVWASVAGFVCLCLASSAVYVTNDISDRHEDRLHPRKKFRAIASGRVRVPTAVALATGLTLAALIWSFALDHGFAVVVCIYLFLQVAYTFVLKHEVIIDVIVLGLGFVLRAIAGGVLIHVEISVWLVLCTFTLCLFMGFSKRRCELNALADGAESHRRTLAFYTPELLNHMTSLSAGIAVVTFILYTTDHSRQNVFKSDLLVYTVPLVVYAIFRFTLLVEQGHIDGPTDVVLKDRPFQVAIGLWIAATLLIVYRGEQIQDAFHRLAGS
jgi:4-hydroxybenzoate polyprenyltransferase